MGQRTAPWRTNCVVPGMRICAGGDQLALVRPVRSNAMQNSIPDLFAPLLVIGQKRNINAAWQKVIMGDSLDGPTSPQHCLVISWACPQRDCLESSGLSTSTGARKTNLPKTGYSSICCISGKCRGWTFSGKMRRHPINDRRTSSPLGPLCGKLPMA